MPQVVFPHWVHCGFLRWVSSSQLFFPSESRRAHPLPSLIHCLSPFFLMLSLCLRLPWDQYPGVRKWISTLKCLKMKLINQNKLFSFGHQAKLKTTKTIHKERQPPPCNQRKVEVDSYDRVANKATSSFPPFLDSAVGWKQFSLQMAAN